MNSYRIIFWIVSLFIFVGCSGRIDSGSKSTSITSASQLETANLKAALKTEPGYKIDDSEVALLQQEGIINEADINQIQTIQ